MAIVSPTPQADQTGYPQFAYPSPRYPDYIRRARATTIEELLPVARVHIGRRYAFPALGPVLAGDHVLLMTYTSQDPLVMETVKRAMLEAGAKQVDVRTWSDLGVREPDKRWSAADGWRECVEPIGPMIEDGVEYKVEATAVRGLPGTPTRVQRLLGGRGRRQSLAPHHQPREVPRQFPVLDLRELHLALLGLPG